MKVEILIGHENRIPDLAPGQLIISDSNQLYIVAQTSVGAFNLVGLNGNRYFSEGMNLSELQLHMAGSWKGSFALFTGKATISN